MTRSKAPAFPFAKAAKTILPSWDISLVFVGERRAETLNRSLRNKEYIPNVLSFAVGTRTGEIIICPSVARKQAPKYELSQTAMVGLLFIHGLLHLKGRVHGDTMERAERELLSRFVSVKSPHAPKNRNRN